MPSPASTPGAVAAQFIRAWGSFLQSYRLYPSESEVMIEAGAKLQEALKQLFAWRNPVALSVLKNRIYVDEFLIRSENDLVTRLLDDMLDRLIRKLVFYREVKYRELQAVADMMKMDVGELRDIGGPAIYLNDDQGVRHIEVVALTLLFGEQTVYASDSWQVAIQRAGLDVDEVGMFFRGPDRPGYEIDVDHEGLMSLRSHRLSSYEVGQLVEILLNPDILAKMLLDVASVPVDNGTLVDPAEIVRILQRTENTMLLHSTVPETDIAKGITAALRMLNAGTRVAACAEIFRRRTIGLLSPVERLFAFTPAEHALALAELTQESGDASWCRSLRFTATDGVPIVNELRTMGEVSEVTELSGGLPKLSRVRLGPSWFERQKPAIETLTDQWTGTDRRQQIEAGLRQTREKLAHQINVGYTFSVLGLLEEESDAERTRQITRNFFEQIHQLIARKQPDFVKALSHFESLLERKDESERKLIAAWLQNEGQEFIEKVAGLVRNLQVGDNRVALEHLLSVFDHLGREPIRLLLDQYYYENVRADSEQAAQTAESSRNGVLAILEDYLSPNYEHFESRFFKTLELYLHMKPDGAPETLRRLVRSDSLEVRQGALLALLHVAGPGISVPIFREIVEQPHSGITNEERILALVGIGLHGIPADADLLARVMEGVKFGDSKPDVEVRRAALFAYAGLLGESARDELPSLHKKIHGSWFSSLFSSRSAQRGKA